MKIKQAGKCHQDEINLIYVLQNIHINHKRL